MSGIGFFKGISSAPPVPGHFLLGRRSFPGYEVQINDSSCHLVGFLLGAIWGGKRWVSSSLLLYGVVFVDNVWGDL